MATTQLGAALRHIDRLYGVGSVAGLTDGQLLRRFLDRRDEAAFAAVVARHGAMVLGVARGTLRDPHDVEDAFQATFLVLVRKAGSIKAGDALAGWLYRVARRVSIQAGVEAARRRREHMAGRVEPAASESGEDRDHIRTLVQDELARLPERFRLPILLCDLEGLTREQAADRLQWTEGTLRGRLARGRERLKARLESRGVAVAGTLAAVLAGRGASAAVPASWAEAAVKAAMAYRAFRVIALGAVSESAATLGDRAIRAMLGARLRGLAVVAAAFVAMGLVAAAVARPGGAGDDPPAPKAQAPAKAEMKRPSVRGPAAARDEAAEDVRDGEVRYAGRVVGPDGEPVAGAEIRVASRFDFDRDVTPPPAVRATTGPEGRFDFTVPKAEFESSWSNEYWAAAPVVATAKGFGPGLGVGPGDDLTLRLVADDVPIEGRVLDIDGRPVAGATVRVTTLMWHPDGNLDPWLEAMKAEQVAYTVQYRVLKAWISPEVGSMVGPATTGPDGRFRLDGVGRERVVGLWIEAPTIETTFVHARTRPGETLKYPEFSRYDTDGRKVAYHGAKFDQVVGPTQVVVGTVRDADTGKPLAGAVVQGATAVGNPLRYIETTTDAEGRYRLTGLSTNKDYLGNDNAIVARPPDGEPYPMVQRGVERGNTLEPVTIDVAMKRGVWIEGRVIDKGTGKSVPASLEYFVFRDDPHVKDYPSIGYPNVGTPLQTEGDGTFRIVGIPGRGIVGVRKGNEGYRIGVGAERLWKDMDERSRGILSTVPNGCMPSNFNTLVVIDIPEGADSVPCDVPLDPGHTIKGRAVGPDGEPRSKLMAYGLADYYRFWRDRPGGAEAFEITALGPDDRRLVLVAHEADRLAGMAVAEGDGPDAMTVAMQPWAEITGRLVDEDGNPVASAELKSRDFVQDREKGLGVGSVPDELITLEDDGRFHIRGLLPGLKYKFTLETSHRIVDEPIVDLTVEAGEVKDLGDVKTKRP